MCREPMQEQFARESNETSPIRVPSAVCVPLEHETAPVPMQKMYTDIPTSALLSEEDVVPF